MLDLPGLEVEAVPFDDVSARFEIMLRLIDTAEAGMLCLFEYAADLFDTSTMQRMAGHFRTLLEAIVADADRRIADLEMLGEAERRQLLVEWNPPAGGVPGLSAAGLALDTPVGRPVPPMRAYVLDPSLALAPIGVTGELYVGGMLGVQGYVGPADLTGEEFVADAVVSDPLAPPDRLYRTGHLARWRRDGTWSCAVGPPIARRSGATGSISARSRRRSGSVPVSRRRPSRCAGSRRRALARGLFVAAAGVTLEPAELRATLWQRHPEYTVPTTIVVLDALPVLPSGYVDRSALPAPEDDASTPTYVAPRTPTEETLAGIWLELLGVEQIGIHDSFFELGGHSLLATLMVARLREVYGFELPLRALFEAPTIAGLAEVVGNIQWSRGEPAALEANDEEMGVI